MYLMTEHITNIFVHNDSTIQLETTSYGGANEITLRFTRPEERGQVVVYIFSDMFQSFIDAIAKDKGICDAFLATIAKQPESDNQPVDSQG